MTGSQRKIVGSTAILFLAVAIAAGPSIAGGVKTSTRAAPVQAVLDCRSITEDARRLACFDAAVGAMVVAETKGDLVTIDREQRREVRKQAFGLILPSLAMFDRGEKGEDTDKITTSVIEAGRGPNGRWLIQLEGGATWRQIDDTDLYKTPHKGSVAVVRKGALGSFFMKIDGDTAFRAHRDN